MAFAYPLETNMTSYFGSMEAHTYEATGPGPAYPPTNIVRTDQPWGIKVDWEAVGPLTVWLNANFQVQVVLERMGPGPDITLPPVSINTLIGTAGTDPMGTPKRTYTADVPVAAGGVAEGIYRVLAALQLFDDTTPASPTPIAGFADSGYVNIFKPKP